MALLEYGIGGNEVRTDASEAIADIPGNRSLIVEQLTSDEPVKENFKFASVADFSVKNMTGSSPFLKVGICLDIRLRDFVREERQSHAITVRKRADIHITARTLSTGEPVRMGYALYPGPLSNE